MTDRLEAEKERIGMKNFETAKSIMRALGIDKEPHILLSSQRKCCENCEKYGPAEGKPCMSLRMTLDLGCDYTPPEWCRDITTKPQ